MFSCFFDPGLKDEYNSSQTVGISMVDVNCSLPQSYQPFSPNCFMMFRFLALLAGDFKC